MIDFEAAPARGDETTLRHLARDLVALSMLPQIWAAPDLGASLQSLVDALSGVLRTSYVVIRVRAANGDVVEATTDDGIRKHPTVVEHLRNVLADGSASVLSARVQLAGGTTSLHIASSPIEMDGVIRGVVLACFPERPADDYERLLLNTGAAQAAIRLQRDKIEARRATEAQLARANELRSEQVMQLMPTAVCTCDREGRVTFFNRRVGELLGCTPQLGAEWTEFAARFAICLPNGTRVTPDAAPMMRALRHRESLRQIEVQLTRPDGVRIDVTANVEPLFDNPGQINGAIMVFEDITRIKVAEQASRRLASIVESSDDAIIGVTLEGTITTWNAGAERMFGYLPDEIVGHSVKLLLPPDRFDEEPAILHRISRGFHTDHYETVRRRKDGTLLDISLSVSPVKDEYGRIIGASKIARDVTGRRRAEVRQHALYEMLASVNRAAALNEIYEVALDAILRCQGADRASLLLYDDQQIMRFVAWRGLSEAYRAAVEGHSPWKPDERDPQPVCISDVAQAKLSPTLHEVIAREGIVALVFVPLTYEGRLVGKFMLYHDTRHEFTAEEIELVSAIATQVAFAIERRKGAQALETLVNERTNSLRQAIAQMEEFSYSVSHDLRSPVRAMRGYAEALLQDYGARLDAEGRELLARIERSGRRMDQLIQDLLTYTRISRRDLQLEAVSLAKLVPEVLQQYPELRPENADIELCSPLPDVIAHEPSLTQVISNLMSNAVKFVPAGRRPRVRVTAQTAGGRVRLSIQDNGIGVKPEYQHRLFAMFERIHPQGKYEGTGIGLAIVRKAIERMNGRVGMQSDGSNGSCFWIELPTGDAS